MSIFDTIFGASEQSSTPLIIKWIPLEDLGQLNEIILLSDEKPVVIFKHST
jgi:hypothetical protein